MSVHLVTVRDGVKRMRPILSREEYMALRDSDDNRRAEKRQMVQMNYSCLPNDDGTLRGSRRMSMTVGMDVDIHKNENEDEKEYQARLAEIPEKVLAKKEELGLLMLERSASKGYHLVFRRRVELSQEDNLRWASQLLGVEYDQGAKDITRVFFTPADKLLFLDDAIFDQSLAPATPSSGSALQERGEPRRIVQQEKADDGGRMYKGIPYSAIISRLLLAMGVDGSPDAGERNNYLYGLARELRYITDFSVEKIVAVLPDWGLPQEEVRRTVASAVNTVRKSDIPMKLQNIINLLKSEQATLAEDGEEPEKPEELMIPQRLPKFFRVLLKAYPEDYREAALMASFVPLGGLLTRLRAYYLDGAEHTPSFIGCIRSPQASGKSFARHLFQMLTEPIRAQDTIYRNMEREYNEKRKAAKNTKSQPEDPRVKIRIIPATASNAMILKRADYAEGLHLLTFAEEIDTITKGNKAGAWSAKSDLYRMAFDNAEWGQDYMSDNSYSGTVKIAYNLLMCGTPHAVERCFSDVEDGLVSRIMFITLPDMLGARMPKFGRYSKRDKEYIASCCQQLYTMGEDGKDGQLWVETKKLELAFESWLEEKRMQFLQSQDNPALEIFRRRSAVIGFRAGMVAWAIEDRRMTKEAIDLALWVAEVTLAHQLELYGEAMNKALENDCNAMIAYSRKGRNIRLFDELPGVFDIADIMCIRQSHGLMGDARHIPSRWLTNGLIEKVGKNRWRKL